MAEAKYIRQSETESIAGDKIYLCYFVTCTEDNNSCDGKCYGVGIDMYTQKSGQRTDKLSKTAEGIFRTKLEAELFIQLLYSGFVTPTTLDDVIEDNIQSELA